MYEPYENSLNLTKDELKKLKIKKHVVKLLKIQKQCTLYLRKTDKLKQELQICKEEKHHFLNGHHYIIKEVK